MKTIELKMTWHEADRLDSAIQDRIGYLQDLILKNYQTIEENPEDYGWIREDTDLLWKISRSIKEQSLKYKDQKDENNRT